MNNADLYGADILLWAEHQADALRRRASNEIDWENVAEENRGRGQKPVAHRCLASGSSAPP